MNEMVQKQNFLYTRRTFQIFKTRRKSQWFFFFQVASTNDTFLSKTKKYRVHVSNILCINIVSISFEMNVSINRISIFFKKMGTEEFQGVIDKQINKTGSFSRAEIY